MPRAKKVSEIKVPEPDDEKFEQESVETKVVAPEIKSESTIAPDLAAKVQAELSKIKASKSSRSTKVTEKPLVEGINTPQLESGDFSFNPNLTFQEKQLISETPELGDKPAEKPAATEKFDKAMRPEPKLMPVSVVNRASGKSGGGKKRFLLFLIFAFVLGFAGYKFYLMNKDDGSAPNTQAAVKPQPQPENNGFLATTTIETATTTPAVATTTPVATPAKQIKISSTPTGWLNFRTGPGTNYPIITKVYPGETYEYTEVSSGWYKIIVSDGKSGWVIGQYATVVK